MAYTLSQMWLPESLYGLKASYAMTPQGIVVHNTAGSASARSEATAMLNNGSSVSYHVVIDETEAIELIPFSRNAWHAGDGSTGYANRNLIGIEIARSMDYSDDKYDRAEANAVEYIAWVCVQYGWTSNELNQHNWYSGTDSRITGRPSATRSTQGLPRSRPTVMAIHRRITQTRQPLMSKERLRSRCTAMSEMSAASIRMVPSMSACVICSARWAMM